MVQMSAYNAGIPPIYKYPQLVTNVSENVILA